VNPLIELLRIPSPEHHHRGKADYRRHGSREEYLSGYLPPTTIPSKLLRHPWNLIIVELILSPILFATGVHFPSVLLHNQSYPKVCPDPLNLPNAGDSFAGISSLSSCYLFSPDQGLNCLI
jgi:hypothetical protein